MFTWIISLLIMVPRLFVYDTVDFVDYTECSRIQLSMSMRRLDSGCMFLGLYVMPLVVLSVCHLRIGVVLWRRRRITQSTGQTASMERRRLTNIMLALTLAFAVGWLPLHIMNMYEDFAYDYPTLIFGDNVILVLGFCFTANAINPFLYCMLSKHFRQYFCSVILSCIYKRTTTVGFFVK